MELPPSLGQLTRLEELDLSGNLQLRTPPSFIVAAGSLVLFLGTVNVYLILPQGRIESSSTCRTSREEERRRTRGAWS
jgi:Leucine-rich repeat (LRR) protein